MKNILSVVLPAYNEGLMVGKTCRVLGEVLKGAGIPYELVLVNDGSSDNTWEEILKAGHKDPAVLGVRFSRNFGKEAAVFAGMAQASGDVVAVMDCDLQHPPETLIEMYDLWKQGYEVIEGVKKSRGKESFFHRESAGFFYGIMSKATGIDMQNASDFKMMDRQVVDNILAMPERNMFFRATSSWVGFKTTSVEFEVHEREAGETKWSTWSLVKYAAPVCDDRRRNLFSGFADPDHLFADPVFYRTCSGGIHNHASGVSPDWKCDHAEPWYNRILYCQDL